MLSKAFAKAISSQLEEEARFVFDAYVIAAK